LRDQPLQLVERQKAENSETSGGGPPCCLRTSAPRQTEAENDQRDKANIQDQRQQQSHIRIAIFEKPDRGAFGKPQQLFPGE
jgi:hypothetical protein